MIFPTIRMKKIFRIAFAAVALVAFTMPALAQESSSSAVMRRGSRNKQQQQNSEVTARMQQRLQSEPTSDSELSWMKVVYRSLDLNKEKNAPLYFPEMPIDGNESLFRLIIRLLANDQLTVYEYLDGREVFTDEHRIKTRDVLDRYHIYYQEGKGSSDKHPKFDIHESDVPATEVLSYYIIERWEYDTRINRMKTRVEAICPVLHRSDEYGMDAMKYPMFWVKYDDIRPYLSTQNIFTSDYNNLPSCTYDDYFQMGLYEGDIYKTRNLRNRSMKQIYLTPDELKRAQDSIQHELDTFEDKLWVPSMEELEKRNARKEAVAKKENGSEDESAVDSKDESVEKRNISTRRGSKESKSPVKVKRSNTKAPKTKNSPTRSVRNRKR